MKNNLNIALEIAAKVHIGKKGRNREPAILHPLRVMESMDSNILRIIAILHDVVESSPLAISDIKKNGFGKKVCSAVDALSRRKSEKYIDYINRVKTNKLAIKVKKEDLIDNCKRRLTYKKIEKIDLKKIEKYKKAYIQLTGEEIKF